PWRSGPPATVLEHRYAGPLVATGLLLLPAWMAVVAANRVAGFMDSRIAGSLDQVVALVAHGPAWISTLLAGRYGLLTMGPLLFVWAVPVVVLHAILIAAYKASGLLDRMTAAMHPIVRPFGLGGRDLVRIVMGFGCNVPAVV